MSTAAADHHGEADTQGVMTIISKEMPKFHYQYSTPLGERKTTLTDILCEATKRLHNEPNAV
jgi:hypothetical protein